MIHRGATDVATPSECLIALVSSSSSSSSSSHSSVISFPLFHLSFSPFYFSKFIHSVFRSFPLSFFFFLSGFSQLNQVNWCRQQSGHVVWPTSRDTSQLPIRWNIHQFILMARQWRWPIKSADSIREIFSSCFLVALRLDQFERLQRVTWPALPINDKDSLSILRHRSVWRLFKDLLGYFDSELRDPIPWFHGIFKDSSWIVLMKLGGTNCC